jgi:hypothetical protein
MVDLERPRFSASLRRPAKLERLRGHKLTCVDASALVFLAQLRIGEVWGTDRDLSIEGANVVPTGT